MRRLGRALVFSGVLGSYVHAGYRLALMVMDYRCDAKPGDPVVDERHERFSVSYVRRGSFGYQLRGAKYELVAGATLVGQAEYDRTFAINAKGAFFSAQRLAPLVRDGGAFVFTTSIADVLGSVGMSVYSGAKAALRSSRPGRAAGRASEVQRAGFTRNRR